MFDLNKSLEAGKISLAAMLGIWLVALVLSFVPVINILAGMLSLLQFFVLNPILLGYAGYNGTKKLGMDMAGAALTGGAVGFVASAIMSVVGVLLSVLGIGVVAASYGGGEGAAFGAIALVAVLVGAVISIVIHTVGGLACGAIGSFVAAKK